MSVASNDAIRGLKKKGGFHVNSKAYHHAIHAINLTKSLLDHRLEFPHKLHIRLALRGKLYGLLTLFTGEEAKYIFSLRKT